MAVYDIVVSAIPYLTEFMTRSPKSRTPLTPPVFHLLLAVADGARHGYEIIKEIERRSEGGIVLSTGTLYAAIKRLLADGLLEETDHGMNVANEDDRRRYYRLTPFGRKVTKAEVARMIQLIRIADEKRLVSRHLFPTPVRQGGR